MTKLLFEAPARAVDLPAHAYAPTPDHLAPAPARRVTDPQTPAEQLAYDYESVRLFSQRLAAPLALEDQCIQSMPDVSPTKWHLAHTSWFYERFILHEHVRDYESIHPQYDYLFNSYYNGAGPQHCRPQRGLLSRPTVAEVHDYRRAIDDRMVELILGADVGQLDALRPLVLLGLNHEQQHQELMLTDIKHVFSCNPLLPAYRPREGQNKGDDLGARHAQPGPAPRVAVQGGVHEIDFAGDGFCYDNETPRHRVYLDDFALAAWPVTNGEYLRFIEDGGYERADLWLSAGWATVQAQGWRMPIYWYRDGAEGDGPWMQFTLAGPVPLDPAEPVCHLSYFEADAFARWCGARLPTEAEWEVACRDADRDGTFVEDLRFHPAPLTDRHRPADTLRRCFGDVWEWTSSHYSPYPGYRPLPGTLGEYNGKFMCNQFVLRGGSCATSRSHIRPT